MAAASPSCIVVIVDDEPLVRVYARDVVEEAGYSVAEAANAEDALRLLGDTAVLAVLTDIEMPGMNGVELAWKIQADHPGLSVVVMSGHILPNARDLPPGVQFISKPFSPERLTAVLAALIAS